MEQQRKQENKGLSNKLVNSISIGLVCAGIITTYCGISKYNDLRNQELARKQRIVEEQIRKREEDSKYYIVRKTVQRAVEWVVDQTKVHYNFK